MRITGIKTHMLNVGFRDWIIVKLETDEGITGLGEATMEGRERAVLGSLKEMESYLIGKDPRQIELHWNTIVRDGYFQPSVTLLSALAGVEMAMWDILGKQLGVPVYALLGGACRDRVPVYNNAWYFGAKTLDDYARLASEAVAQGFNHLKWDPFWEYDLFPDREQILRAKECVRLVREAVGDDVELLIECHGRFSPDSAVRIAHELEEFRPYWLEEPIPPNSRVDSLAWVTANVNTRIAAGERMYTRWGFWEALDKHAVAVIQPDTIHCGGILETKKIAALAHVSYVGVAPHSPCGPVLAAANAHIDFSTPNFLIQEFFYPDAPVYHEILKDPWPLPVNGAIELPQKPGLGVELNEEAIERRVFEFRDRLYIGGLWKNLEEFEKR